MTSPYRPPSRDLRKTLRSAWLTSLVLLVGCSPSLPSPTGAPPSTSTPSATVSEPGTQDPPPSPTAGDGLDLREANVLGVSFEEVRPGEVRFEVTLYHDDEGEAPKYADWWQVETIDGEVLGIRELLHSHGTAPFTRAKNVGIPTGTTIVIVRGHDMTHGFGGQAAEVNLETGEVSFFTTEEDG